MKLKKFKLSDLTSAEYNPRTITNEALKGLSKSLEKFGYLSPLVVNVRDGKKTVISGHQRLKAMLAEGGAEAECVVVDFDPAMEKAANIALNSETISGDWDLEGLETILEELKVELPEFDEMNFDDLAESLEIGLDENARAENENDADQMPEVPEKVVIKTGDLIELGAHRLLCGNSTRKEDVKRLMGKEKADMVFIDPPYDFQDNSLYCYINEFFTKNAHIFVMHDDCGTAEYLKHSKLLFKRFFVADFGMASPRGNDPYLRHILVSHEINGKAHKHQNMHDGFSSIIKMKYRRNLNAETEHKHEKSVEFVEKFINHYSKSGNLILDYFLGSGTTLIASEKNKRQCFGMELEPKFCQVIIQRWVNFTENNKITINGKVKNWEKLCS